MTDPKRYADKHDEPDPDGANPVGGKDVDRQAARNRHEQNAKRAGLVDEAPFKGAVDREINRQLKGGKGNEYTGKRLKSPLHDNERSPD